MPASHSRIDPDRARAIRHALTMRPGDVVLIAGKGHEDYQIYGKERRPFSDQAWCSASLEPRSGCGMTHAARRRDAAARCTAPIAPFAGVSTDTRTVKAGELFVALRGRASTPTISSPLRTPRRRGRAGRTVSCGRIAQVVVPDTLAG